MSGQLEAWRGWVPVTKDGKDMGSLKCEPGQETEYVPAKGAVLKLSDLKYLVETVEELVGRQT